jgi:hypothetical protein
MNKFILTILLTIIFCVNANSQIPKIENCYSAKSFYLIDEDIDYWTEENFLSINIWVWDNEKQEKFPYSSTIDIEPNERFELFKRFEERSYTIKLDTGIITETNIYTDFFYKVDKSDYEKKNNKPYMGKKYNLTDYLITNYTEDRIFANRVDYFEENNIKLKRSESNLVVDLLTNKVEIFVTSYDLNQNVDSKTDRIIYCKPPQLMESNNQNSGSFFKNILGDLFNK